jgi:UDP-N-acetylglucosamine 2-epimerase (non-hydrolysing)
MKTILSVASARPNFVKLAAVHHALAARPDDFQHIIVHTGQHYDPLLSDIFFEQLEIPQPDANLGVHGGTRVEVINATAAAVTPLLQEYKPDVVLVYGDVNGAVGAARAASILGITVAHVEAGLRSGDLDMPEEHNRIEIDALADILFCTEQSGMDHLEQEKNKGTKYLVGNTMIDTLSRMMPVVGSLPLPESFADERFAIVTLHRPSNVDNPVVLERLMTFLNDLSADISLILPVHPRLRQALEQSKKIVPGDNVLLVDPLGYIEFIRLIQGAAFILTDSGGIQEEATFLGKRCFTLRRNTERPSTIDSGSNILINPDSAYDRQLVFDWAKYSPVLTVKTPPLWDGRTGKRIADILLTA